MTTKKKKSADIKGSGVNTVISDAAPERPMKGAAKMPETQVPEKSPVAVAPVPAPKKAPEKKDEKKKDEGPKKAPSIVRLDIFLATQFKPDQAAGFAYWAKKKKLKPRSIADWRVAHAEFLSRPV